MPSRAVLDVGIDLDDTLIPNTFLYHGPIYDCCKIISQALGSKSPYPPKLVGLQQQIDMDMVKTWSFNINRFPTSWIMTYRTICDQAGVQSDPTVEQELLETAAGFMRGPFRPFDGAIDALAALRQTGHALHLITAGDIGLQNRKIDEANLRYSFEPDNIHVTGANKREAMAKVFGGKFERGVMVGDSLGSDIETAHRLGVKTVWIPSETWAFADAKKPVEPTFTIRSIAELPAVIEHICRKQ